MISGKTIDLEGFENAIDEIKDKGNISESELSKITSILEISNEEFVDLGNTFSDWMLERENIIETYGEKVLDSAIAYIPIKNSDVQLRALGMGGNVYCNENAPGGCPNGSYSVCFSAYETCVYNAYANHNNCTPWCTTSTITVVLTSGTAGAIFGTFIPGVGNAIAWCVGALSAAPAAIINYGNCIENCAQAFYQHCNFCKVQFPECCS